jgi:zinc D-Ala-D-Ala dipeptidase
LAGSPPRFDLPHTTRPAHIVLAEHGVVVADGDVLPTLIEPPVVPVTRPRVEPLVTLRHRRVRTLANYWHAGWTSAQDGMWLRSEAAERLYAAADCLPGRFGFAVFDAWRPLALQAELFDVAYADPGLPPGYISFPTDDPTVPPPHLTGGTVDLTLTFDGIPLALGTDFDDFTADAATDAFEGRPGTVRALRRMLYRSMHDVGFVVLDCEWWHFEYGTPRWAAILGNEPFYGPASLD